MDMMLCFVQYLGFINMYLFLHTLSTHKDLHYLALLLLQCEVTVLSRQK